MKFDDIMAALPREVGTADQMAAGIDFLLEAEDMPSAEREAFACGYLAGMTYVLAASNEGRIPDAARRVLDRMAEYERRGWT